MYQITHKLYRLHYFLAVIIVSVAVLTCCSSEESSTSKQPLEQSVSSKEQAPPPPPPVDLLALLKATHSTQEAQAVNIKQLAAAASDQQSPLWPVYTYLYGELLLLRNDTLSARQSFEKLASWAVTNPYGDGWGGSGLASVALWRWLKLLNAEPAPDPGEAAKLIQTAKALLQTRLARGMFNTPVISALPQLEEDIARQLAILAWSVNHKDEVQQFFLDYLRVASKLEFNSVEAEIVNQIFISGLASPDRFNLFLGKRLYSLKRYKEAADLFSEAKKSSNLQVQTEADLYLAHIMWNDKKGASRVEVAELLRSVYESATDPNIAQEALFRLAVVLYREGEGKDIEGAIKIYEQLLEKFPQGRLADDALYKLAQHYQDTDSLDNALTYYERLRNFKGENDWINMASFQPALALYTRGNPEDIKNAYALLQDLNKNQPYGPLYLNSLFWLGRIASEQMNDKAEGQKYFRRIITESPYDYYAIRARIHLRFEDFEDYQNKAGEEFWPDDETKKELSKAFQQSRIYISMAGNSPYHLRLQHALQTGLYTAASEELKELHKLFPSKRLENISTADLNRVLPSVSVLLALRQDAFCAKDVQDSTENRMQIAGAIGHHAKDWPMMLTLINPAGEPVEKRIAIQKDASYLATAYPFVFEDKIKEASAAYNVMPELIYSVMRRDSLFYPPALSQSGALGLFQFMPGTFDRLNKKWQLLESSGADSPEAFLFNPKLSIPLGARWFKEELLEHQHGNYLFALMEHNAGKGAVDAWAVNWINNGLHRDIEYMIETIRFTQTSIFVRSVLTDMAIMDASGLLKESVSCNN